MKKVLSFLFFFLLAVILILAQLGFVTFTIGY